MRATTTPTYTPVPMVMERAARKRARREAMLASGKSPLFTALVVCSGEREEESVSDALSREEAREGADGDPFFRRMIITGCFCRRSVDVQERGEERGREKGTKE